MKILIFWDVYGRIWRKWLKAELPWLKEKYNPDFVIANIENCTSWRWPIEKHVIELEKLWIDIMTSWDHVFDNYQKIKDYLGADNSKLLRCANFYNDDLAWKWYRIFEKNWKKLLMIHLIWEVFMPHNSFNPFLKIEEILENHKDEKLDWIVLDFHAEATWEAVWMWHFLDWKASLVFWTHTHVQTNDDIILPKWTGYISDVWMNGALYSVIWAEFESVRNRFLEWVRRWKLEQCLDENYLVSWLYVEIWDDMKCTKIEKIKIKWK